MSVIDMLVAHIAGMPTNVTTSADRDIAQEIPAGKSGAGTQGLFSALLGALAENGEPADPEAPIDADSGSGLHDAAEAALTMTGAALRMAPPDEPAADTSEEPEGSDVPDAAGESADATAPTVPVAFLRGDAPAPPIAPSPATKLEVETPPRVLEGTPFPPARPLSRELAGPVATVATVATVAALPAPAHATRETDPVASAPIAADEAGPLAPVSASFETSSDVADDPAFDERSAEEGIAPQSASAEDACMEPLPEEPLVERAASRSTAPRENTPAHTARAAKDSPTSSPDSVSLTAPASGTTTSVVSSSPSLPIESAAWTLRETPALLETATNTSLGPSASAAPVASDSLEWTPEIRFELAARAKEFLDRGETEIRLTLDPPSLGKLRIRLEIGEGRVAAHLVASSAGTAALLDRHREELVRAFAAQGIQDVSVEVGAERDFDRKGSDFFEERGTFDRAAPLEPSLQQVRRFSGARARVDLVA